MRVALLFTIAALHAQQPRNCPGFPNCLYTPASETEFVGQAIPITYDDVTGTERTFEAYVRVPNVRGKMPVVIWAHGGGEGIGEARSGTFERPSILTASAGYLTITPAFRARNPEQQKALCAFVGADTEQLCSIVNSTTWDRPYDIQAIIRLLRRENAREDSPLYGRVDMERIAVGGHSAGSGGTFAVAGAYREILDKRYGGLDYFEDPTPIAFIVLSPSAPGDSNMFDTSYRRPETSWDNVTRPVLMLSGEGDAHQQFPHGRKVAFDHLPEANGSHYRFWFNDVAFGHGQYAEDPCDAAGRRKCDVFLQTWGSLILSYLDGYLLKNQRALDYLNNGYATRVTPPFFTIDMLRK